MPTMPATPAMMIGLDALLPWMLGAGLVLVGCRLAVGGALEDAAARGVLRGAAIAGAVLLALALAVGATGRPLPPRDGATHRAAMREPPRAHSLAAQQGGLARVIEIVEWPWRR